MRDLLEGVISAHGGIARWNAFTTLQATIATGGALWRMKGFVSDYDPREITVWLHEERMSLSPFAAPNQRTVFTPDRIAIESTDGATVAERFNPRQSFDGHSESTPWDTLHRAYFSGYALWTYLTTPFLLAMPGVESEEIEPWTDGVGIWRRLRARFPSNIATHSSVQDFFFDRDLMLCRHDYRVDVVGGFAAAQLVSEYTEVQGLRMPTKRRAFRRGANDRPIAEPRMVALDISNIRLA